MGRTWPRVKNVENSLVGSQRVSLSRKRSRYDKLVLEYYVVATERPSVIAGVETITVWKDTPHHWVIKSKTPYQFAVEYIQTTAQAVTRTYMEM